MTDRTILAIDLSTARGEIAVVQGETLIFENAFQSERSHNAQVFAPLQQALAIAGSKLDLIVIGTGPGSYTGVRIAIAAAQGVALSRQVPVIGWPSITAPPLDRTAYRVIGDARRGCFYTASVEAGQIVTPLEILEAAQAQATVEEDNSATWLTFDTKAPFGLAEQIQLTHPSAAGLARHALTLSEAEVAQRAALPLEPVYLQDPFITTSKRAGKIPGV